MEEMGPKYHSLAESIRKMRVPEAVAVNQITQSLHRVTESQSHRIQLRYRRDPDQQDGFPITMLVSDLRTRFKEEGDHPFPYY